LANRVKIVFNSNPAVFEIMSLTVYNTALGYSNTLSKTFISSFSLQPNQVQIGATLTETMVNLLANLNANELDGNATFTASGTNGFYVDFNIVENYSYTFSSGTYIADYTVSAETVTPIYLEPITLEALDVKDVSIRIFDTYTNDRILTEELASASACKIDWDGGDDLYKSVMASKLVFNMLVPEAEDVHFLHLFSSDEQRYRVEVVAIDADENEQLIWQGFLLPDQYNEPYQQVSFFVDFTATDMLASLKGKYLPPWYYENKLPIAEVFAYCLAQSGLQQNLLVAPAVIPEGNFNLWHSVNVDLRAFIDGEKFKDCYSIVESVLGSQMLIIYSYRGYWWLEGISRKNNTSFLNYQFDIDGNRIEDVIFDKKIVDCGGSLQPTPMFTALTPWNEVNVGFKADGSKNLFSDNIIALEKSEIYNTNYTSGNYVGPTAPVTVSEVYSVGKIKDWFANLNIDFLYMYYNYKELMWRTTLFSGSSYTDYLDGFNYYRYTEAMVLNNYLETTEKPYVKPGVLYELEAEFLAENVIIWNNHTSIQRIEEKRNAGGYDKLVPIQILLDGIEKYSNRPSFGGNGLLRYTVTSEINEVAGKYSCNFTFKLKFPFKVEVDGLLSIRILMPILDNFMNPDDLDNTTSISRNCFFYGKKLKLTAIEGYDENNDTTGIRNVNFTQKLSYDLDLSCSVDNSVTNSLGIGLPLNQDYFEVIDKTNNGYEVINYNRFSPATLLELKLQTFQSNYVLFYKLFANNKFKSCFLEKANGYKKQFQSLWYYFNNPVIRMGYLKSYEGFPVIPKSYKAYPDVETEDVLKFMDVRYAPEDYRKRLRWRLWGSDVIDTYPKTVAKGLHAVQPEVMFRLEASALKLLFPTDLIEFYFDNQDKKFIPTRLQLDLFNGKTTFIATEAKYVEFEDISYE
jgi:hypothetical protein